MNTEVTNLVARIKALQSGETQLQHDGREVTFSINNGAHDIEILQLEEKMNLSIPIEFIDFLKCINGCTLYKEDNINGYLILGTDQIIEATQDNMGIYEEDWDTSVLLFCDLIGEGNYLGFRLLGENKYEIIDCFHEEEPSEWRPITLSFVELINKIIDSKGDRIWFDYYKDNS